MKKAFLCHSSQDKEYVRIVAKHLGRAKVIFDEMSFESGQDFRSEILKGLDKASLFVYFVSRASLDSIWCKFEIDEAHKRKILGKMESQLVIIIDRDVRINDLPEWMQAFKAVIQTRPSQASRDIQTSFFAVTSPELGRPYVGRQDNQQELGKALSSTSRTVPRVIVLSGLDGVGRRTYLERSCRDLLGLNLGPYFVIDETHQLDDLYLWVLNETADLGTRNHLAEEIKAFSKLEDSDKRAEIIGRLNILCSDNCLPCLVDRGGMLDENGEYRKEYSELLRLFLEKSEDHYLAIVHKRWPKLSNLAFEESIFYQKVGPLKEHESRLLLQQLLRKIDQKPSADVLEDITDYLDGYPPAAYFSASFSKLYGLDCLIADKSLLNDFKAKRFTRFINDLKLSEKEWFVLQYLASEQALPLSAIAVAIESRIEEVVPLIKNLIDYNLILVADSNFTVSMPIVAAIFRAKHHLPADTYARIQENLTAAFWKKDDQAPTVEIVDATLHAVARSGSTDFNPYKDLVRVSTIHKLAKECYHRKEFNNALEYSKRAEQMDSARPDVRGIYFKSLVQLEHWKDAEKKLEQIGQHGDRHYYYLKGFLLRKRHRYLEAIKAFQSALDCGDHTYPVYRDYADCLYREARYDEAAEKLQWVLDRDSENIFVLDLIARILIDANALDEAKGYIDDLARFDIDERFIHHRKASYLYAKGMWELALTEIEVACDTGLAPFEAYARKISILIELQRFQDALARLDELKKKFGTHRSDIQLGLRCKLLIRQGRWHEAKTVWDKMRNKNLPVHLRLLQRILELKVVDPTISLVERETATKEIEEIKTSLEDSVIQNELDEEVEDI